MGLFSFSWFKSEKQKEMEKLQLQQMQIANDLLTRMVGKVVEGPKPSVVNKKPYLNIKLVNNVLTVILNDGNILSKPNASEVDFQKARLATCEEQLFDIVSSAEGLKEKKAFEEEVKKSQAIIDGIEVLKTLEDFEVKENTVYLKGTNRSIPQLLIDKFALLATSPGFDAHKNTEYIALKRFFLWCCLNPRAEVADKLYDFLTRNQMRITRQGFFVGLRNVKNVPGNNHELVNFVTNVYQKVKAVWNQNPESYIVYKDLEGYGFRRKDSVRITDIETLGNLQELYSNLPNMAGNRYTDGWTSTFDIRVGKVVAMRPEDCNWSTQDCATAGLHFAGHTAPYVLYGDTTVFTLHNPMKVVGIGEEKGRCWEYLPFMTTNVAEADEIMHSADFDFLQLDEQYAEDELNGLAEKVKNGFAREAKKYQFNLPTISSKELNTIVASLEDMKEVLNKRVQVIEEVTSFPQVSDKLIIVHTEHLTDGSSDEDEDDDEYREEEWEEDDKYSEYEW